MRGYENYLTQTLESIHTRLWRPRPGFFSLPNGSRLARWTSTPEEDVDAPTTLYRNYQNSGLVDRRLSDSRLLDRCSRPRAEDATARALGPPSLDG